MVGRGLLDTANASLDTLHARDELQGQTDREKMKRNFSLSPYAACAVNTKKRVTFSIQSRTDSDVGPGKNVEGGADVTRESSGPQREGLLLLLPVQAAVVQQQPEPDAVPK